MKFFNKDEKGITLIALIITIIILVILAAVSINAAYNSGIINYAVNGTQNYAQEAYYEQSRIANAESLMDSVMARLENLGNTIDFDAIKAQAVANRVDGEAIGIGTDGSIVDLSNWSLGITAYDGSSKTADLCNHAGSSYISAYTGSFVGGKIVGTVPQYILPENEDDWYTVTSMNSTFYGCSSLLVAPEIPSTVTRMESTFKSCTGLISSPVIPGGVTHLDWTFLGCSSLTGDMVINVSGTPSYIQCFEDAATGEGCDLKLTGSASSTVLSNILATKSSGSHISLKDS